MSQGCPASRPLSYLPLALTALALAGCARAVGTQPLAWIDVPLSGAVVVTGETVEIHTHAYAADGVAEGMLTVNGEPYWREPPTEPGASFAEFIQTWVAGEPGLYHLSFTAYDTNGQASLPAVTSLTVVAPPTPTATPEPTPTPTPVPLTVEFSAERASLTAGECTRLVWRVEGAGVVLLDGANVEPEGTRDICPSATATYRLQAFSDTGSEERLVTVTVNPPPDNAGPTITGLGHNPEYIWGGTNCGPTEATVSVTVSDPSGVAGVELHYRVVWGSQQGQWRVVAMTQAGGSSYSRALTLADLSRSQALYGDDMVEYYVVARDSVGNVSQSGTLSFVVRLCFG